MDINMERDQESVSNTQEVVEKLNEAEKNIPVLKGQTINLLGKTGSGKSTVLCLLSGLQPMICSNESGETIVDFHQEGDSKIVIGHGSSSCTTFPNLKTIGSDIYWDCPGFCDNKSITQEIVNIFGIKKIFDYATEYKIVLVIEHSSINAARGRDVAETFKHLVEMFPEQNQLFNALSIVITKCPDRKYTGKNFVNKLDKMAGENNDFAISRQLIRMIAMAPEKIAIFKVPEEESDITLNLRNELDLVIRGSKYAMMKVQNSLSDRAKLTIDRLIKLYEKDIGDKMNEFAQALIIKFKSEKNMEALKIGKQALDRFSAQHEDEDNNVKRFEANFIKLGEYFTSSEALISEIKDLTYRIEFYNNYRSRHSPSINLSSWLSPMIVAKVEIETCINFQNEIIARQQAEEFNKQNQEKIIELTKKIESINSNHDEKMKWMQEFEKMSEERDRKNSETIAAILRSNREMISEISSRPPHYVSSGGPFPNCNVF